MKALLEDATGFEIRAIRPHGQTQGNRIDWSEVVTASAFKRDLLTYDLVCILFSLRDGRQFEVHEDMQGWQAFLDCLPASLPGFIPFSEWAERVVMPAFATNETVLYSAP